jgi:hypothetical protein
MEETQIATVESSGVFAATLDQSGKFLVVDFAGPEGPKQLLRVVFPAESLRMLAEQLNLLVKAMDDPQSGIKMPQPH